MAATAASTIMRKSASTSSIAAISSTRSSRCWYEVTWVAAASYLTRDEARKRFKPYSGDAYQEAEYCVDKDSKEVGGADARERAKFWEIWHKPSRRVLWVAKGCEDILDEDDPHLDLHEFLPVSEAGLWLHPARLASCPCQMSCSTRTSLRSSTCLPTAFMHLSEAVEAKGFYPAGGGEIGKAIETAIKLKAPGVVMVPIKNWATFGQGGDPVIWLPIDKIAQTVTALVMLRKQIIEDIYQIMGLSDIMRGATDPQETLGAQQFKTQYGSSRIRDKQQEMVRIARDLVEIVGEIIVEKFDKVTMIEMSPDATADRADAADAGDADPAADAEPADGDREDADAGAAGSADQADGRAEAGNGAADRCSKFSSCMQSGQDAIKKILEEPNIDQVFYFLKSNRIRSFVLDIETDSTIQIDENAEKQRRTEFMQVLGGLIPQLSAMIAAEPKTAKFAGDVLKFATAPFRAGRQLEASIDELVELMEGKADQPRPDDPTTAAIKGQKEIEQIKQDRQRETDKATLQLKQQELQMRDQHEQAKIAVEREDQAGRARRAGRRTTSRAPT